MNKQQQIDKIAQAMCGFCTEDKRCVLKYSAPCSDIASQDCTCKESAEELIYKGYGNVSEYKAEIERLKDDYAKLQEQFAQYQMASDKEIMAQVKQAQIDVLNELKKKTHNYYSSIDSYCVSQHIVLVRDIDELIKEVKDA